jgi:hypothetical protein
VAEETGEDLSYCKIYPEGFSSDKPPALKFHALLT